MKKAILGVTALMLVVASGGTVWFHTKQVSALQSGKVVEIQSQGNYCYPNISVPPVVNYDSDGKAHIVDQSQKMNQLHSEQSQLSDAMQTVMHDEQDIASDSHANSSSPKQAHMNQDVSYYNSLLSKYDTCTNR